MTAPQAPQSFRKNGYDYRLVLEREGFAIFEQFDKYGVQAYEVHILRSWPLLIAQDSRYRKLAGTVRLASNEEWGRFGWTCFTLDEAERKVAALMAQRSGP